MLMASDAYSDKDCFNNKDCLKLNFLERLCDLEQIKSTSQLIRALHWVLL